MSQEKSDNTVISPINGGLIAYGINHTQLDEVFKKIHENGHGSSEIALEIKKLMDKCPQYSKPGGYGHRILYGHSISDIAAAYQEHGAKGVLEFGKHLGKDFTSPHGLPLPYAKEVKNALNLNMEETIKWLTQNLTDMIEYSLAGIGILTDIVCDAPPSSKLVNGIIAGVVGAMTDNTILLIQSGTAIIASIVGFVMGKDGTITFVFENFRNINNDINTQHKTVKTTLENFKNI